MKTAKAHLVAGRRPGWAALSIACAALLGGPCLAQSATDCEAVDAQIARAEQARRAAQEDSDNAWKAVVPFVVLARKASAKSAIDEADKQLAALKAQRAACEDGRGR